MAVFVMTVRYSLAVVGALDSKNNNTADMDVTSAAHRALVRDPHVAQLSSSTTFACTTLAWHEPRSGLWR
jgi:hypothetical protein